MMLACWMCSFPGFPWAVRFEHPGHVYYAWLIVIVALVLATLPFLLGYRIGPQMPYSWKAHGKFFLLFGIILGAMMSDLMSFGGSLALFLNLIDWLLALLIGTLFGTIASAFDSKDIITNICALLGVIVGHALYTWVIVLIDRPLIKPEKTKPERDMKNGKTD